MKGVILQKGAFNPLHRMHKRIADDAIKMYPEYEHYMVLCMKTCDKGIVSASELRERAEVIEAAGYMSEIEYDGLFISSIDLWRGRQEDVPIVFAVGEDTMYRFFRDWDKYYTENHPDEYLKRYSDYEEKFKDVTWYVSKRECPERTQYKLRLDDYMKHHDNLVWSPLDLDHISSSMIRAAQTMKLKDVGKKDE